MSEEVKSQPNPLNKAERIGKSQEQTVNAAGFTVAAIVFVQSLFVILAHTNGSESVINPLITGLITSISILALLPCIARLTRSFTQLLIELHSSDKNDTTTEQSGPAA